ncbi:TPA: replication factor C large subunit [Candidatus Micrarchaeota archaeon]|nr:replication factor C large subunit [Candidatus Micrarchaeota archaeon]
MILHQVKSKSIASLIGNPTAFSEAKKWADGWQQGSVQPALLVFGPTGIGKTALAHAIASEFGWEMFEFNASDLRDEESVNRLLGNAAASWGLFGARRLILIDDADSLSGREDRGGASAIAAILSSPKQPIILTALDLYDKKLQAIKAHCQPLKLQRVHTSSIAILLKKAAAASGAIFDDNQLSSIASSSSGDVRAALNDLQARNLNARRDSEKNIFEVVRTILKSEKYAEARKAAFDSETEHDTLKLWVAQNITAEYEKPFEIAEAYSSLSRADIFDGRIARRQYWGFLRYSTDHLSSGVATAKSAPYRKWTQISYPDYIREMGASKAARTLRKGILKKISGCCHCSIEQAASYLPLVELLAKKNAKETAGIFGFEEEESDFVLKKKAAKKETGKKKAAKK